MPIKLKTGGQNGLELKAPIKQLGGGAVDSVNGMTGDVVLDIPSKTSDLINDSGFLTEHQSLDEYATQVYVDNAVSGIEIPEDTFYVEVVDNKVTTPIADYYAAFQEGKRVVLNNFTSSFGNEYNFVLTYCTSATARFCSVFPNYNSGEVDGIQLKVAQVSSSGVITVKYYVAPLKTALNDYYTRVQVNALVDTCAKKTDIPDVSGYQTEEQVQALIDTAIASITDAEEVSY